MDIHGETELPELTETAKRVYAVATARPSISAQQICSDSHLDQFDVEFAVDGLCRLGLLRSAPNNPEHLIAVSPDSARLQVTGPLIRSVRQTQEQIDRINTRLLDLVPLYTAGARARLDPYESESISDLEVVRKVITELAATATSEVLTSQPGGPRPEEILAESMQRTEDLLARNVQMRTLYQHTAQFSQATVNYVDRITAGGAEVRTTATGFTRALIFDRQAAVISLKGHQAGALVVRNPSIVEFIAETFDRWWSQGTPFPTQYDRDQVITAASEVQQAITDLLIEGYSDRKIAQRVGLSLRTCQRHIAEIMRRIGAQNRLHAGYLLHDARLAPSRATRPGPGSKGMAALGEQVAPVAQRAGEVSATPQSPRILPSARSSGASDAVLAGQ
ncbi:LuxR C-terminal-related transcriptional regulator [Streptomyces sp. CL12]|uniref:LuxR C-terminal-related transcriptional regulator n=1 Tax=Streptomyces sp. CL12 TaxID=3391744 RepID=UPI003A80A1D2